MAYRKIDEISLVSLADSIREKTRKTALLEFPNGFTKEIGTLINPDVYLAQILNKEITEIATEMATGTLPSNFQKNNENLIKVNLPHITSLEEATFNGCTNLSSVNLPYVTTMGASNFAKTNITELSMPSLRTITSWGYNFNLCSKLQKVFFPNLTALTVQDFYNCSRLTTLILGAPTICVLPSTKVFEGTPIAGVTTATNGKVGYIYVQKVFVERYKSATNWSAFADRIRAIEDYPDIIGG